jgi:hypothetical protein
MKKIKELLSDMWGGLSNLVVGVFVVIGVVMVQSVGSPL